MLRWGFEPYRVRFRRPLLTGSGLWREREGLWVAVVDADGAVGLGEVAPLPAWGTESLDMARRALAALKTTPDGPPSVALAALDRDRTPAAYAGAEQALLDLEARRRGVPLAALLAASGMRSTAWTMGQGAAMHRSLLHPLEACGFGPPQGDNAGEGWAQAVPVNALLSATDPEALAVEAAEAVREGFRALKLKVGALSLPEDLERLAAVRAAVGPDVELRLDANGSWSRTQALAALMAFAPFGPAYVEQPVADLDGLRWLRRESGVPVAADELAGDRIALETLLAEGGVDVLVAKPLALGGLTRSMALAEAAARVGLAVVWTSALDRGLGAAGALHLAAALGTTTPCGLATAGLFEGPAIAEPPTAGTLPVRGPGTGAIPPDAGLAALLERLRHDHASLA